MNYCLGSEEIAEINSELHTKLKSGFQFSVTHLYDNDIRIGLSVDEKPVIESLLAKTTVSSDALTAIKKATSIRAIPTLLKDVSLTETDKTFLAEIESRIAKTQWESVVQWEVSKWLESRIPKFLYFSDYDLLPSKMNLADLAHRTEQAKN